MNKRISYNCGSFGGNGGTIKGIMCACPCDNRTKQIKVNFFLRENSTRYLSHLSCHFGELLFFSSIVLPLKIQQWKMVNTQRKCGNDSVASVKISQKSEEKSGTSKKHGSNLLT